MEQEFLREPTTEEVAEAMGPSWSAEKVEEVRDFARLPVQLETPVGDENDSVYGDFIPDAARSPFELASETLLGEGLEQALAKLTEREAAVLRLRKGFVDGRERDLGGGRRGVFGVTRERIRQIENKALRKLKYHESRNRQLRDFLE